MSTRSKTSLVQPPPPINAAAPPKAWGSSGSSKAWGSSGGRFIRPRERYRPARVGSRRRAAAARHATRRRWSCCPNNSSVFELPRALPRSDADADWTSQFHQFIAFHRALPVEEHSNGLRIANAIPSAWPESGFESPCPLLASRLLHAAGATRPRAPRVWLPASRWETSRARPFRGERWYSPSTAPRSRSSISIHTNPDSLLTTGSSGPYSTAWSSHCRTIASAHGWPGAGTWPPTDRRIRFTCATM